MALSLKQLALKQLGSLLLWGIFLSRLVWLQTGIIGAEPPKVILDSYRQELQRLIDDCDSKGMALEKKVTLQLLNQTDVRRLGNIILRSNPLPVDLPVGATDEQKKWYESLQQLKRQTAKSFFDRAKEEATAKKGYDALDLTIITLSIDPDHPEARKIFDYSLIENRWQTSWEQRQTRRGFQNQPKWGMVKEEDIAQYEQGLIPLRNQWIPLEEYHNRLTKNFTPLRIETEHYQVETSISIESGVALSRLLEDFYQAWRILFYRFMITDKQALQIFLGNAKFPTKQHRVVCYRDREEYLKELGKLESHIEQSHGGFFPHRGAIFVYLPPEEDDPLSMMLYHESTHQLFAEYRLGTGNRSRTTAKSMPGKLHNYWVIEAMGTIMENIRIEGGHFEIASTESVRFKRAQQRCREPGGLLPLRRFCTLSFEQFQSMEELPMLYTEAAGLATFFFNANDGKYVDRFLAYLFLVYEEQDEIRSLEQIMSMTFEELDAEFRRFLMETDKDK